MSDERKLSRRASLRGIVATGAIISGTSLSAGTVSASEKKVDSIKEIDFKDCHSMAVHLKDGHETVPITIRAYNDDSERIENIQQTIKKKELLPYELWKEIHDGNDHEDDLDDYDDHDDKKKDDDHDEKCLCGEHDDDDHKKKGDHDRKYVWTFDIYQFYDHAIDADDKILSVKVGDKRIKNTNDCAKKYSNDYDKKGDIDTDDIGLVAICVNSDTNTARYRVDNWNKKAVTVQYDVYNTDRGGEMMVEPKSTTYFDVEASGSGGEATVRLFYEGEEIDVKASNTERDCLAENDVAFSVNDIDFSKRKIEFYLHDGTDFDRTFNYYNYETGAAGTITVHDDPASAETFWVDAPRCKASVTLFYQGHVVGKAKNDSDLDGPVVNKTQQESYETIQEAVDDANEGDTIIVCEDQEPDGTVVVDVENLTIEGFEKPVVEVNASSAFSIEADGVTVDGLEIRNPASGISATPGDFSGAVGITVSAGSEDACIQNNVITEIGTENDDANAIGVLANDGTSGIKIKNNKITNLEGTDEDQGAVQAILIDESGTPITDVKVKDNTISDLLDTRSTVAVRFNGDVSGDITDNDISDLNTEGTIPGSGGDPGGFTQVISLARGGASTNGPSNVTIEDNSISDIETTTPDNFFAPTHIIVGADADAATITIESNDFSGDSTDDDEFYVIDETGDLDLNTVLDDNSFNPPGDVTSFNGGAIVRDD
ncbi:hypothetical protein halTADL_0597 [Halohasta litchfieldiae]|jgi:hypothetical protein|uniref:Right handed beta helix region n=1 Tax=Halohasta litchfieldiae TaxID=1073996 RepID=A0A1H6UQC0_9EURY|nr:hypothetical protein [Halohasta litchfieldiae]ATW87401.1 hypothetical protein halTADL_0597 [Halohasta litchfieldiae]SEI90450.1 hypothetical protein SAMN05444271_11148 [Halohasta litchfieldiae]